MHREKTLVSYQTTSFLQEHRFVRASFAKGAANEGWRSLFSALFLAVRIQISL